MGPDFIIHIAPPMEMMMEGVPQSEILDMARQNTC